MKLGTLFTALALIAITSQAAMADGFVCQTDRADLNVRIFNNTDPSQGTRNAAVLVLSDPSVHYGRRTIATFTDIKSTLANHGAFYLADIDLRVRGSDRAGELISGTKLGFIDQIMVDIHFAYSRPTQYGEYSPADMTIVKRDGTRLVRHLDCYRYLKN